MTTTTTFSSPQFTLRIHSHDKEAWRPSKERTPVINVESPIHAKSENFHLADFIDNRELHRWGGDAKTTEIAKIQIKSGVFRVRNEYVT